MSDIQLLRELHAKRFCDRHIADCLSDPALIEWDKLPDAQQVVGVIPFSAQRWSTYQVWYQRKKLGLAAAEHPRTEHKELNEARAWHRRLYARRWLSIAERGIDLRRCEVDIVDALELHGRLTRSQICQVVKRKRLHSKKGYNYLRALIRHGVVVENIHWQGRKRITTYQLAGWVSRWSEADLA